MSYGGDNLLGNIFKCQSVSEKTAYVDGQGADQVVKFFGVLPYMVEILGKGCTMCVGKSLHDPSFNHGRAVSGKIETAFLV